VPRYDQSLFALHYNNKVLIKRSGVAQKELKTAAARINREEKAWSALSAEMSTLPALYQNLVNTQRKLQILCIRTRELEKVMLAVEKETYKKQIQNWKNLHDKQLVDHRNERIKALQDLEKELKLRQDAEHHERYQRLQEKQRQFLQAEQDERERIRAELERKAAEELRNYQLYGGWGNEQQTSSPMSLADVDVPQSNELENFLAGASPEEDAHLSRFLEQAENQVAVYYDHDDLEPLSHHVGIAREEMPEDSNESKDGEKEPTAQDVVPVEDEQPDVENRPVIAQDEMPSPPPKRLSEDTTIEKPPTDAVDQTG